MFSGIIQDQGQIKSYVRKNDGAKVQIKSNLPRKFFKKGSSIAVNGVCLTVESYKNKVFTAFLVGETITRTNFSSLKIGDFVNLEPSLTLESLISGHLVSGHVDFIAKVLLSGENFQIKIPLKYKKYFPVKGSICVNGVALTIVDSKKNVLSIALIPETLKSTNLSLLKKNDLVNIEIDLIARYLENLIK